MVCFRASRDGFGFNIRVLVEREMYLNEAVGMEKRGRVIGVVEVCVVGVGVGGDMGEVC